jgi:hypothetical protein
VKENEYIIANYYVMHSLLIITRMWHSERLCLRTYARHAKARQVHETQVHSKLICTSNLLICVRVISQYITFYLGCYITNVQTRTNDVKAREQSFVVRISSYDDVPESK